MNRTFDLNGRGMRGEWALLAPWGEWPHRAGLQVVNREAGTRMVEAFAKTLRPVVVDLDHESEDESKRTEAAGWVEALEARDDGLWGKMRWTDLGAQLLANGRYRYLSPTWRGTKEGARLYPSLLKSVALTNQPNLPLPPLTNRAATASTTEPKPNMDYKKTLCEVLGLPETSDDAAIDAAIATRKVAPAEAAQKETALTNRLAAAEAALAEYDLAKYEQVITNRETVREALRRDRAGTLALLAALRPQEKPLTNRESTAAPTPAPGADEVRAAKVRGRATELSANGRLSWGDAWAQAEREVGASA